MILICIGLFGVVCFSWSIIPRCPFSCCCDCFFSFVWHCSAVIGIVSSSYCFCSVRCSLCLVVFLMMFSVFVRLGSVCCPCSPSFFLVLFVGFGRCGTSSGVVSCLGFLCSVVVGIFSSGGVIIICIG